MTACPAHIIARWHEAARHIQDGIFVQTVLEGTDFLRKRGNTPAIRRIDLGKQFAIHRVRVVVSGKELQMRMKRSGVHSFSPLASDSNRADSSPIVAVLAKEPVFAELALETHARFLAQGYPDTSADLIGFQQWIARDDVIR